MDLSRAYAPTTDSALLTHTSAYTRQFCWLLAYELAQTLPQWTVAETFNEDDAGAQAHVFVVRESQWTDCGFVALDIQGLHDASELTDQFMADDWAPVDAEEMFAEWSQDCSESGIEITDAMQAQAQAVAKALVEHLADEIADQ